MNGQLKRAVIKTEYVCWTIFPFYPVHCEPWRSLWEPLTMLEGFQGEPEEDDWVEEAVQTMGPEDLQNRSERDGGEGGGKGEGVE